MKKIPLFFIIIFCLTVYSQQERFIEVTAIDTVSLSPVKFTYEIKPVKNYTKLQDTGISLQEKLEKLENILKDENYTEITLVNKFNTSDYSDFPAYQIKLNTISEVEKLYNIIEKYDGYSSKIILVDYESPVPYKEEMLRKIYERAYKEASYIASVSGNTIGRVISIEEPKSIWDGFNETFTGEMKKNLSYLYGANLTDNLKYFVKKTYKFELK